MKSAYRQIEISDTCILRGLARLHTSTFTYFIIFVFEHEAPGNVLSHHLIISLMSAQDKPRGGILGNTASLITEYLIRGAETTGLNALGFL